MRDRQQNKDSGRERDCLSDSEEVASVTASAKTGSIGMTSGFKLQHLYRSRKRMLVFASVRALARGN